MKTPTGSVRKRGKRYLARITWTDPEGKRRSRTSLEDSSAAAHDAIRDWRRQWKQTGTVEAPRPAKSVPSETRTFADLYARCKEKHFVRPVWKEGKLIAGMRSWEDHVQRGAVLVEYLGTKEVASITPADCEGVRDALHAREVVQVRGKLGRVGQGKTLSIATVNHHMKLLRRMLNIAVDEGWIARSPFRKNLVKTGLETARDRVLTAEEEARLLAACRKPRRARLYSVVVIAIETGLRLGEVLKLRWRDVDFDAGVLSPLASHTKTLQRRFVGMTERTRAELEKARELAGHPHPNSPVFGLKSINTAWRAARAEAGLDATEYDTDGSLAMGRVVFHTLRHTASTNMQEARVPEGMVQRTLGHASRGMTYRYTHVSMQMAQRIAKMIDKRRAKSRLAAARAAFKAEAVN